MVICAFLGGPSNPQESGFHTIHLFKPANSKLTLDQERFALVIRHIKLPVHIVQDESLDRFISGCRPIRLQLSCPLLAITAM